MADNNVFFTSIAILFGEKVSSLRALLTCFPLIICATRLSLRGLTRIVRKFAIAESSDNCRGVFDFDMLTLFLLSYPLHAHDRCVLGRILQTYARPCFQ